MPCRLKHGGRDEDAREARELRYTCDVKLTPRITSAIRQIGVQQRILAAMKEKR